MNNGCHNCKNDRCFTKINNPEEIHTLPPCTGFINTQNENRKSKGEYKIMSDFKDVILRVKIDSYKDLQNFIHNELKLTKPDIEKLIEKFTSAILNEKLSNVDWVEKYIDKNIKK